MVIRRQSGMLSLSSLTGAVALASLACGTTDAGSTVAPPAQPPTVAASLPIGGSTTVGSGSQASLIGGSSGGEFVLVVADTAIDGSSAAVAFQVATSGITAAGAVSPPSTSRVPVPGSDASAAPRLDFDFAARLNERSQAQLAPKVALARRAWGDAARSTRGASVTRSIAPTQVGDLHVGADDYSAGLDLVLESENVVMTRTFSKIHGLATLRLGWMVGPPDVVDAVNRIRGPFNISGIGIAAGAAAIADEAHVAAAVAHNDTWLARMSEGVSALGLTVTPSVANFILVHFPQSPGRTAAEADAHLTARGVIVRRVSAYGLPDALRVTIGTQVANEAFLAALTEFVRGGSWENARARG